MKEVVVYIVGLCLVFSIGCAKQTEVTTKTENPVNPQPMPDETKPLIYAHVANMTSAELCDRLISIDTIPSRDPNVTDPIYESLIAKGDEAIPCLVDKISDATPMPDPRDSVPHWQHFAVGDVAVFVLIDILRDADPEREKLLVEMLPPKYEEEWESNGIYAYFNYVSEPKNRKQLQGWWKNWLKDNKR